MKLYAFGCSNTAGYRLEKHKTDSPDLSFPNQIAEHLGIECVNLARPGFDNLCIVDRIMDTKISQDDLVISQFTFMHRQTIINDMARTKFRHFNQSEREMRLHHRISSATNDLIKSGMMIDLAYLHLVRNGINKIFFTCCDMDFNPIHALRHANLYETSIVHFIEKSFRKYKKALDGNHPGKEAHRDYAFFLIPQINQLLDRTKNQ